MVVASSFRWLLRASLVLACLGIAAAPTAQAMDCPAGLTAESRGSSAVHLDWAPVPGAQTYQILRAQGASPPAPAQLTLLESTGVTEHEDASIESGETYWYVVTAVGMGEESTSCTAVSASTIPFFPSVGVTLLAAFGVILVSHILRKK